MRAQYLIFKILLTLFFLCFAQEETYAWFHAAENWNDCPAFEPPSSTESVSKTYGLLPNTLEAAPKIHLYRVVPQSSFPVSAGELKIDIPFNLLTTSVTNVQSLLDRQIAANLKLENILKQYLEQQKRNADMLKDLSIPYLEAPTPPKKTEPAPHAEDLPPVDVLKKKIAEAIIFQAGDKERGLLQNSRNLESVSTGETIKVDSVPNLEKYERALPSTYFNNLRKTATYIKKHDHNAELPWIFSFGLKLIRYISNNKIEILSWTTILAFIGMIGTIMVRR